MLQSRKVRIASATLWEPVCDAVKEHEEHVDNLGRQSGGNYIESCATIELRVLETVTRLLGLREKLDFNIFSSV